MSDKVKGRYFQAEFEGVKIGHVTDIDGPNVSHESIDISDYDSGEWVERMAGRKDWTVSLTVDHSASGSNQELIRDAIINGPATGSIKVTPVASQSGDPTFSGSAIISSTSFTPGASNDKVEESYEFEGDGPLNISVAT